MSEVENLEEARKALQDEAKKRADLCSAEVAEVLKKHRCEMDIFFIASARGNSFQVRMVPQ